MTIAEFIQKHGITMTTEATQRPDAADWGKDARHFRVEIRGPRAIMSTSYSMGSGLKGEPSITDVLDCLRSDASGVLGSSFEDWAADLGMDTDSRKAERTYRACRDTAVDLRVTLGEPAFDELLNDVESL